MSVCTVEHTYTHTPHYSQPQYCTAQYSTVQYTTVQYTTVLYCTVQYCTVLYSTVLYCRVQYSIAAAITCRHECVCTVEHTYTHHATDNHAALYTVAIHINNNNNNNKRPALYTHLVYAVKRAPITVTDITNE